MIEIFYKTIIIFKWYDIIFTKFIALQPKIIYVCIYPDIAKQNKNTPTLVDTSEI